MTPRREDDLSAIAADDALLDTLGRGDPPPDDDKLAGLMATWRHDLDADGPAPFDVTAILADLAVDPAGANGVRPASPGDPAADEAPPASPGDRVAGEAPPTRPGRWRPGRRVRGYLAGVAAALLLIAGLSAGAGRAGPESPLWPIARVLYPERADLRLAEHTIAQARAAAAAGRYDDARRTLDRADDDVQRVDDTTRAGRLRAEIDDIRRTLPPADDAGTVPAPATPSPSTPVPPPAATPPAPTGGQPGQPGQPGGGRPGGGGQPGGGPTGNPGGGIVPELPTPTLPIPVPTLPVPDLPLDVSPDVPDR